MYQPFTLLRLNGKRYDEEVRNRRKFYANISQYIWRLLVVALMFVACGPEEPSEPAPTPEYTNRLPTMRWGAGGKRLLRCAFVDVTREAGLEFRHETGARGDKWMPETYGQRLRAF